nr:unnamed protein product [Spirometra erinaceieuropaei]
MSPPPPSPDSPAPSYSATPLKLSADMCVDKCTEKGEEKAATNRLHFPIICLRLVRLELTELGDSRIALLVVMHVPSDSLIAL